MRFSQNVLILLLIGFSIPSGAQPLQLTQPFDENWRFLKADAPGAEVATFDDSGWREVRVPHDWSIEGPFDQNNKTGGAGAFLPAGIGWYRKTFSMPPGSEESRAFIDFDGVMANSDVWINGFHLGKRPYGYVSFRYELTGHLNYGTKDNILAVRADNSAQPASRWYAGAGIYRHVRLVVTDPIHFDHWATFITTPRVSASEAEVHVQTSVINQSDAAKQATVETKILGPDGMGVVAARTKPQAIAPGKSIAFEQDLTVQAPLLWNLETPVLYSIVTDVVSGKRIVDHQLTRIGIREFHFDPATGFWLNGKNFKIKGICMHFDAGGLGTAVPLSVWERRVRLLQQVGVNAVRTSHNPPAPEFLDVCDRLGMLVMDEMFDCWTVAKNPYDYHLYFNEWSQIDTRDTVRRDRNHPSVILYSAGNEIHDTPKTELAHEILASLVSTFHQNDPTRPVTQALFRPNVSHDYDNGLADMLDVVGQNYRENEILAAHASKPARKILGTENGHDLKIWLALRDNPPYSGQFLWTGIDYLGESRQWPVIGSSTGLLDRTGKPHGRGLERESWWSEKPVVHVVRRTGAAAATPTDPGYEAQPARNRDSLFPDWTPYDPSTHDETVEIYSNCEEVELVLNGRSLGSKPRHADDSPRTWTVAFATGVLHAIGKNGAHVVANDELRTAGKPAKVILKAERQQLPNDWDDVSYVRAEVTDEYGVVVPTAKDQITFKISGPGTIAAVDNGDSNSHELFQVSQRQAYHGECIAVLRATASRGLIVLIASAPGLQSGSASINAEPPNRQ